MKNDYRPTGIQELICTRQNHELIDELLSLSQIADTEPLLARGYTWGFCSSNGPFNGLVLHFEMDCAFATPGIYQIRPINANVAKITVQTMHSFEV